MKLLSSHFVAPVVLSALSVVVAVAGCSSDQSPGGGTAGASPGGASSGGKAGSGGGVSVAGAPAGGAGGTAGAGTAGAGTAGAGTAGAGTAGAGTAGAGTAGAGTAGGGPTVEASFATVKAMINMSCFGGGCHGEAGNPLQMEIDDKLYGTLMSHMTAHCGKLVNTTSPADSALVKLLLADCGGTPRMPYHSCWDGDKPEDNPTCVPTATVDAVKAWIMKGAPQQ
ncbi:MAG TPA: hypothetical protein VER11_11905 [Polyangiaceae bacterium]|jgi:hypothetical protein|nr:hypothetical protein [Polyangiaceae bacterium]